MKSNHEGQSGQGAIKVREPVQVYLEPEDRERLVRIRSLSGGSKSDALREGLRALERELTDPAAHPALQIIGIAGGELRNRGRAESESESESESEVGTTGLDPAIDHDEVLAVDEIASWGRDTGGSA